MLRVSAEAANVRALQQVGNVILMSVGTVGLGNPIFCHSILNVNNSVD